MCQPARKKDSIYQHKEMCFSFTGGWRRHNRVGSNSDNVLDVNDLFISSPPLRRQVMEPLARQCGEHTSCCLRVASLLARFEFQSATKRWVSSRNRDASHAAAMMSPTLVVNPQVWRLKKQPKDRTLTECTKTELNVQKSPSSSHSRVTTWVRGWDPCVRWPTIMSREAWEVQKVRLLKVINIAQHSWWQGSLCRNL